MAKENLLEFDPIFRECKKTLNSLKKNCKGFIYKKDKDLTVIEEKHYKDIKRLDENLNRVYSIFEKLAKYKDTEKEYNAKLQYLVKATQEAIFINKDGICLATNQAAVDMFGYNSIEEMIGIFGTDVIAPKSRELVKNRMLNNIPGTYEAIGLRKDGTKFPVQIQAKKMSYKGEINRATVIRDISDLKEAEQKLKESEEKKLQESDEKFRTLYENIAGGTLIIDKDYIIKDVNDRTCELTGYLREELVGQPCDIVCPKGSASKQCPIWAENKDGFRGMDTAIKCKDGSKKPILKNAKKIKLEETVHVLENFQDISRQKQLEYKLRESEEKSREAYERANFYKDLFAHDINNILNNILSSVQLYNIYRKNPEKKKNFDVLMGIISGSAYRGANLISNVRKLSQLEEFGISLEPIEVCGVLNDALNFTLKSFQERKINIRYDFQRKEFFVIANELLLDVFENILINAVKYNESIPVEILIKISAIKNKEKDYIKMEFLDNGIGISNTKKKIVFHRGYAKEKNTKGMGFGLSLVKIVMDNYNGKIWVEDKVKGMYTKGSNFILLIPEADNN